MFGDLRKKVARHIRNKSVARLRLKAGGAFKLGSLAGNRRQGSPSRDGCGGRMHPKRRVVVLDFNRPLPFHFFRKKSKQLFLLFTYLLALDPNDILGSHVHTQTLTHLTTSPSYQTLSPSHQMRTRLPTRASPRSSSLATSHTTSPILSTIETAVQSDDDTRLPTTAATDGAPPASAQKERVGYSHGGCPGTP